MVREPSQRNAIATILRHQLGAMLNRAANDSAQSMVTVKITVQVQLSSSWATASTRPPLRALLRPSVDMGSSDGIGHEVGCPRRTAHP
jgi:hypothetical protein